jgi:hypothetical protein
MTDAQAQELSLLAKSVIVVAVVLIIAGLISHPVTIDACQRFGRDLIERPTGPMRFRFILQPLMAAIAAIRDGFRDVRAGRSPFFVAVLRNPQERAGGLIEGLNSTSRIIVLGVVMDVIYQLVVFETFYPNEALVVALLLAFVPYMIFRGLVVRVWRNRAAAHSGR